MTTRSELYSRLGLTKSISNAVLEQAYKNEEEQIWRENLQDDPHGESWHLSFHASSFPGDNPKACGRQAIYTLMNIPAQKPINRQGRAVMEAGKAIEEQIVWRFYRSGTLLTNSPDSKHQINFENRDYWLTGSPDAIIKTPSKNPRPLPIEIKTKDGEVIEKMQSAKRSYDQAHRRQTLTYIGLAKDSYIHNLAPIKDGELIYASRDRPSDTHTYRFEYDSGFMEQGYATLAAWRDSYLEEHLPERPKEWSWQEPPCKWCPFKKRCKLDYKEKIDKLRESNTIEWAEEIRGEYDYEETRQKVLDRWGVS